MGENKMETLGEDTTQVECKQPDDNEGGIRRRLRDRDLLRKRKAEAEEKAIYQVQSKRKRSEGKSGPGRKGRPKKIEASVPTQFSQEEAPQDKLDGEKQPQDGSPSHPEEQLPQDPAKNEEPVIPDAGQPEEPLTANPAQEPPAAATERETESVPPPTLPHALSQTLMSLFPPPGPLDPPAPEPQPETVPVPVPVPVPSQEQAPAPAVRSAAPEEQVTIEDLGPDDEEAKPSPSGELVMDPGRMEEPDDNVTDRTQVFTIPTIVSPPQPSYLPGPSL